MLELFAPEVIHAEDPQWTSYLLADASEHSRYHLAHGRRFFALLVTPDDSPIIGATVDQISVPVGYWSPSEQRHTFRDHD